MGKVLRLVKLALDFFKLPLGKVTGNIGNFVIVLGLNHHEKSCQLTLVVCFFDLHARFKDPLHEGEVFLSAAFLQSLDPMLLLQDVLSAVDVVLQSLERN